DNACDVAGQPLGDDEDQQRREQQGEDEEGQAAEKIAGHSASATRFWTTGITTRTLWRVQNFSRDAEGWQERVSICPLAYVGNASNPDYNRTRLSRAVCLLLTIAPHFRCQNRERHTRSRCLGTAHPPAGRIPCQPGRARVGRRAVEAS